MEKIFEIKRKVDNLLDQQPVIGIAVIAVPFIADILISALFYWMSGVFGHGAFYYLKEIILTLLFDIVCSALGYYVIYYYTIEKPLVTIADNRYITFGLSAVAIAYLKSLLGALITSILFGYSWYNVNPVTFVINFVGIISIIKSLFSTLTGFAWIFNMGFITGILILILVLLGIVANLVNVGCVGFFILYDLKLKEKLNMIEKDTVIDVEVSETKEEEKVTIEEATVYEDVKTETVQKEKSEHTEQEKKLISQNSVDMFMLTNNKYFSSDKILIIKDKLSKMTEEQFLIASAIEYKDPTMIFIMSLLLGGLGIDRFMLGDTGMGILKLLTGGCCGVLTIIDWFTISNKAKEYNFKKFMVL